MSSGRFWTIAMAAFVLLIGAHTGGAWADNSEVMDGQGGWGAQANTQAPANFECPAGWSCAPKAPPPGFECPAGWSCAPKTHMPAPQPKPEPKSTYEQKRDNCKSRFRRCYRQLYGDSGGGGGDD